MKMNLFQDGMPKIWELVCQLFSMKLAQQANRLQILQLLVDLMDQVVGKVASEGAKFNQMKRQLENLLNAFKSSQGISKVIQAAKSMKARGDIVKQGIQISVNAGKLMNQIKGLDPKKVTAADIIRVSSKIAVLVDPTDVGSTLASFIYPKCSALFGLLLKTSGKTGSSSSPVTASTSSKVTPKPALKLSVALLKASILQLANPVVSQTQAKEQCKIHKNEQETEIEE